MDGHAGRVRLGHGCCVRVGATVIVTLPDGRELTLPVIHVGILGPPNSGKTEFASSAEKPMLVLAADPLDKMVPYFDRGELDPQEYTGQFGQPIRLVRSRKNRDAVIIQVEGYYDEDAGNPNAMSQLLARLPQVTEEVKQGRWRTVVIDSWSALEWIARARRSAGPFQASDSPFLEAMNDLEAIVNSRLMNLRCNLVITFHIETKVVKDRKGNIVKDSKMDAGGGIQTYTVQAIGQRLKNIGNVLGEFYRAVAPLDGTDNYYLQTRQSPDFSVLCSRIKAPDPCANQWNALFGPWIETQVQRAAAPAAAQPDAGSPPPSKE